ncbi:MAG TPA: glycosyltransferase, partial [Planctomycetaceae bacterium]|nr:glycosyltransferase [Planctomycetaceae bacterium]
MTQALLQTRTTPHRAGDAHSAKGLKTRVAMVTPWQGVCGNAEYAHKLVQGLSHRVDVVPLRLAAYPHAKGHLANLLAAIEASSVDVVHIQHEYVFFGSDPIASNRALLDFVSKVNRPIVITLHTVSHAPLSGISLRHRWLTAAFQLVQRLCGLVNWRIVRTSLRKLTEFLRRWDALHRALEKSSAIIVHTQHSSEILASYFPDIAQKIRVVPIPVMTSPEIGEPPLQKRPGEVWLMLMGFVLEHKRHMLAVDALQHLPENYQLVVAGGPHPHDAGSRRYWRELVREIDRARMTERVVFTGFVADRRQYFGILNLADVFLMPYREVGQSASAVLADILSLGKPIITSAAESLCEYRDDADSWACSFSGHVEDARQFADEILHLHRESSNPKATYKAHAAKAARKYAID